MQRANVFIGQLTEWCWQIVDRVMILLRLYSIDDKINNLIPYVLDVLDVLTITSTIHTSFASVFFPINSIEDTFGMVLV
jgi:hypothetical protein